MQDRTFGGGGGEGKLTWPGQPFPTAHIVIFYEPCPAIELSMLLKSFLTIMINYRLFWYFENKLLMENGILIWGESNPGLDNVPPPHTLTLSMISVLQCNTCLSQVLQPIGESVV